MFQLQMLKKYEIESFYASIQEEINHESKQETLIIIGDWNAKVGNEAEINIAGKFSLGDRNKTGEFFIEFCKTIYYCLLYTSPSPRD